MKVIGYIRVSTEEQAQSGVSLEAQEAKLRAYAELYDIELTEIVVDAGVSGKSLDRMGWGRVALHLHAGFAEGVVVAKLDRLTRNVSDLEYLLDKYFTKDHHLFSVSEQIDTRTAGGRLVLHILMSVAQWEREIIGERTSTAMQHKRAKGEYTGGNVPYGFILKDGDLVEDDRERAIIRTAKTLRERNHSLRQIGSRLLEIGYYPRTGGEWHPSQVKQLVAA